MESAEGAGPITLVGVVCTARVSDTNPFASNNPTRLLQSIALNPSRFAHTADLERASYILVAGSATRFCYDLICSPLYRAFGRKIFVLDFTDRTVPIIPGLYTSLGPSPDTSRYKPTFYLGVGANTALAISVDAEPQFLAWFRGNPATSPIRRRVLGIRDAAFSLEARDTHMRTEPNYARDLQSGKFILCPRGLGASSIRVYEAMRLGRVPVVISDEWMDPPNIPWAECMIRVAERDIERLPDILRAREAEWPAMAAKAREVFDANFSMKAAIVWIDTAIRQIAAARSPGTDRFSFMRATREAARRNFLYHWFREVVRVKTGERTVFMAPQNEWVLTP